MMARAGRRAEGPPGTRRKCIGIGGEDFDKIAPTIDRRSREGCQDFAVGHLGYSCLCRGGEIGTTADGDFDVMRDVTIASIVPRDPCVASRQRKWLEAWICAIKDVEATRKRVPIPVCRRSIDAPVGSDPRDSYDAIMAWVERRRVEVPEHMWASTPLFVRPDGSWWETPHVCALAQKWGGLLGYNKSEIGGKSFRIRGATDIAAEMGCEGGARVVQERGRWHSDVSHIYSRTQAQVQLDASARMANAAGGSLESLIPGWTQPAWRK